MPFSYNDEIDDSKLRLVQLKWGPNNAVHGKVKTVPLSPKQRPIFMAASYFCGAKRHDKPIRLKHHDSRGSAAEFRVYESLYPLLELLCDHQGFEPELWWWIDSICINKDNSQEKEAQVKAMKDIYAAAERTIIWLGTRTFDSDLAIDFLHELNTKRVICWKMYRMSGSLSRTPRSHSNGGRCRVFWRGNGGEGFGQFKNS